MKLLAAIAGLWLAMGALAAVGISDRRAITLADILFGPITLGHELQRQ